MQQYTLPATHQSITDVSDSITCLIWSWAAGEGIRLHDCCFRIWNDPDMALIAADYAEDLGRPAVAQAIRNHAAPLLAEQQRRQAEDARRQREEATRQATRRYLKRISQAVREAAGRKGSNYSIVIVDGFAAPKLRGEPYYWTWTPNPDGTRVWSSKGRSMFRTYYHASTRRIEVGAGWLCERGLTDSMVGADRS